LRILGWYRPNSRAISLELLHVSHSTAAVHLDWLVSVRSVGYPHPRVPLVLHFMCHGDAARIIETQRPDDVLQDNVARILVQHYQLDYYRY
jgi:hypothetical protein